jgi:hypothetical protein
MQIWILHTQSERKPLQSPHRPKKQAMQQLLQLRIPGRLPSWNALLGMDHWARAKLKKSIQQDFISALSLSVNASSIPTILAKNGLSTVSDISVLFREMSQIKSHSKPAKGKRKRARKSTH